MHATTIIGYTYEADLICPSCLRTKAAFENEANGDNAEFTPLDTLLDRWAKRQGIDREDERSFDSDDFPKVVFETGDTCCERCGTCNETLTGDEPCVKYPHKFYPAGLCQNGRCRTLGTGDTCNDGDCLWHDDHPDNPYTCSDWVDNDWCDHIEHQRAVCPEFAEDGSCTHSEHMMKAGL